MRFYNFGSQPTLNPVDVIIGSLVGNPEKFCAFLERRSFLYISKKSVSAFSKNRSALVFQPEFMAMCKFDILTPFETGSDRYLNSFRCKNCSDI